MLFSLQKTISKINDNLERYCEYKSLGVSIEKCLWNLEYILHSGIGVPLAVWGFLSYLTERTGSSKMQKSKPSNKSKTLIGTAA